MTSGLVVSANEAYSDDLHLLTASGRAAASATRKSRLYRDTRPSARTPDPSLLSETSESSEKH